MSPKSMKLELIEWLTRLKDPGMIGALFNFKKVSEQEDWYASLSAEQKASIERGLADAATGRTVSSEEVWKKYGRSTKSRLDP